MYNNSYMGNSYSSPMYNSYGQGYGMYQPQTMQPRQTQPTMTPQQDVPFSDVRFGTIDEAKAYIVMPNRSVMFINRNVGEFYIKTANNMGEPVLESFKYTKLEDLSSEPLKAEIDTKDFVKMQDLDGLATKDDLKVFLTADNTKNFVTRDDIKVLTDKIEQLQKQVRINAILKGDDTNGK